MLSWDDPFQQLAPANSPWPDLMWLCTWPIPPDPEYHQPAALGRRSQLL